MLHCEDVTRKQKITYFQAVYNHANGFVAPAIRSCGYNSKPAKQASLKARIAELHLIKAWGV